MALVADTTTLRYLIEIEAVHVLPTLFAHVIIPPRGGRRAAASENARAGTPLDGLTPLMAPDAAADHPA